MYGEKMKLKKSIEKAKQQRQKAKRKAAEEVSLVEKKETPIEEEIVSSLPERLDAPLPEKAKAPTSEKKGQTQEWSLPVYSESKAIKLDLDKLARNRCVSMFRESLEGEHYKVLRANIQHRLKEHGWNTIMITSVQPGEGKTLTSINLAISFAKEFHQTALLVDCDLRRQNIHKYLDFSFDKGIADYLVNNCQLKDLIVWPNIEKLTIISGGKTITDSPELMGSPKMKALVQEIKKRYDDRYVIFDVPPILSGADAIVFAPLVDSIIMVVEEGRTSLQEVKRALEMIPSEKFLGFVLNRRKEPIHGYYY
jgi:non-specific protein-tyrosine kinase